MALGLEFNLECRTQYTPFDWQSTVKRQGRLISSVGIGCEVVIAVMNDGSV